MNRGVLQMMAAGNPDWWSINAMRPPPTHGHQYHHHHHQQQQPPSPFFPFPQPPPLPPPSSTFFPHFIPTSTSSSPSPSSSSWHDNNQELPESWSQLLMGGLVGEEERGSNIASAVSALQQANSIVDTKPENSASSYVYGHASEDIYHHHPTKPSAANYSAPHQIMAAAAASSPKSCVTTSFGNNMLDFAGNKADIRQPPLDRSSECISSSTATGGGGGALKKTRVQPSATQSTFKVRKEKLGDRITALHQLVSPFGKTDTASVLLEAIGYIRFLQSQIEALSMPYLDNGSSGNMRAQQQSVQGERNCIFPEDPGQLVNENCLKKRKGGPDHQDCNEEPKKDLKSRGLCLVPVSCTLQVGSDNGADYWAPPSLGGGFR